MPAQERDGQEDGVQAQLGGRDQEGQSRCRRSPFSDQGLVKRNHAAGADRHRQADRHPACSRGQVAPAAHPSDRAGRKECAQKPCGQVGQDQCRSALQSQPKKTAAEFNRRVRPDFHAAPGEPTDKQNPKQAAHAFKRQGQAIVGEVCRSRTAMEDHMDQGTAHEGFEQVQELVFGARSKSRTRTPPGCRDRHQARDGSRGDARARSEVEATTRRPARLERGAT